MRVLDQSTRAQVQSVIDANFSQSAANWSGDGGVRSRDAGLIIHDEEIADYYQRIFLDDWDHRARAAIEDDVSARIAGDDEPVPSGMVRMSWRDYYG